MGVGDEQLFDEVLVLGRGRGLAAPSAALSSVVADRLSLRITMVRQGHHDVFLGNQVFEGEVHLVAHDLASALITELLADLDQLVLDHLHQAIRARQNLK